MASFATTELASGETLTIVMTPRGNYRVERRNELGTFVCFAFSAANYADCKAWVEREAARA